MQSLKPRLPSPSPDCSFPRNSPHRQCRHVPAMSHRCCHPVQTPLSTSGCQRWGEWESPHPPPLRAELSLRPSPPAFSSRCVQAEATLQTSSKSLHLLSLAVAGGGAGACRAVTHGGDKNVGKEGWDSDSCATESCPRREGVSMEPYPDVVLPVVSLLEFLRRVGKSLQNKWERRNEPRESKRSQALPTPAQDHGCCPNTQHPCLGVPAATCHPSAALAREQEEALWAAPWKGGSRDREPGFPAHS